MPNKTLTVGLLALLLLFSVTACPGPQKYLAPYAPAVGLMIESATEMRGFGEYVHQGISWNNPEHQLKWDLMWAGYFMAMDAHIESLRAMKAAMEKGEPLPDTVPLPEQPQPEDVVPAPSDGVHYTESEPI